MHPAAERSLLSPVDPRAARRQTMGTMLILVGVLLALAGTGLASSAYLRSVDDTGPGGTLMATLLGTQAPLQLLVGMVAAIAGAVALFFGLLLRSVGDVALLTPPAHSAAPARRTSFVRADTLRDRRVRWGAIGGFVVLFVVAILSAIALAPDAMQARDEVAAQADEGELLFRSEWRGEAANDPKAHLAQQVGGEADRVWHVPSEAVRATVNVSWASVDADSNVLRVVVQRQAGDGWTPIMTAEGPSSLVFTTPLEDVDALRVVVERTKAVETRQPFLLYVSFWSD